MAEPREQITRREFFKMAGKAVGAGLAVYGIGVAFPEEEPGRQRQSRPPRKTPKPQPTAMPQSAVIPEPTVRQPDKLVAEPTKNPEVIPPPDNINALVQLYARSSEAAGLTEKTGDFRKTLDLVRTVLGQKASIGDDINCLSIMLIESNFKNCKGYTGDWWGPMQVDPVTVGDSVNWLSSLLKNKPELAGRLDSNQKKLVTAAGNRSVTEIRKLLVDSKTATFAGVVTYLYHEEDLIKRAYASDFSEDTQRELTIVAYNGGIGWISELVDFYRRHSLKEDIPKAKWSNIASFCLTYAPQFCREETGRVLEGVKPEGPRGLYKLIGDVAVYLARTTHARWANEECLQKLQKGEGIKNPDRYTDRIWERVKSGADESLKAKRFANPAGGYVSYGVPTIPLKSYLA